MLMLKQNTKTFYENKQALSWAMGIDTHGGPSFNSGPSLPMPSLFYPPPNGHTPTPHENTTV